MRHAGLIELRRHYPDVLGQCAGDLLDDLQAGGVDAVIIGAENSHPPERLSDRFHHDQWAVSYPAIAVEANPANRIGVPAPSWHRRLPVPPTASDFPWGFVLRPRQAKRRRFSPAKRDYSSSLL